MCLCVSEREREREAYTCEREIEHLMRDSVTWNTQNEDALAEVHDVEYEAADPTWCVCVLASLAVWRSMVDLH